MNNVNWYKKSQFTEVPLWKIPRKEYIAEIYEKTKEEVNRLDQINTDDMSQEESNIEWQQYDILRKERMKLENQWDQSVKAAISQGLITVDHAINQLGYHSDGHETTHKGWLPLPPILYHVTTNTSSILQSQLKTRYELEMMNGTGLGGGEDKSISFTENINTAKDIKQGIIELKNVAQQNITIQDMINMAESGMDADKPFLNEFKEMGASYFGKGGVEQVLKGKKSKQGSIFGGKNPPDDEHEWTLIEDSWNYWERPMNEEETVQAAMQLYKTFSVAREMSGGPMNPLFFSIDEESYKALNEDEISILECKIKPNSMGYQMGALGEWRTGSGDVVESIERVE